MLSSSPVPFAYSPSIETHPGGLSSDFGSNECLFCVWLCRPYGPQSLSKERNNRDRLIRFYLVLANRCRAGCVFTVPVYSGLFFLTVCFWKCPAGCPAPVRAFGIRRTYFRFTSQVSLNSCFRTLSFSIVLYLLGEWFVKRERRPSLIVVINQIFAFKGITFPIDPDYPDLNFYFARPDRRYSFLFDIFVSDFGP